MSRSLQSSPVALVDLDGTVWDSREGIIASLSATLEEVGVPPRPPGVLAGVIGPPLETTLDTLGVDPGRMLDAVASYRRHYRELGEPSVRLYDGSLHMLDALRDTGWRLVTATSKAVDPVHRILDRLEIADRFTAVAAAPMNGEGADKVSVIAAAIAMVGDGSDGSDGSIVMVGDRGSDIEAARHHGLVSIAARWGYATDGELERSVPDLWATRPHDVVDLGSELRRRFAASEPDR